MTDKVTPNKIPVLFVKLKNPRRSLNDRGTEYVKKIVDDPKRNRLVSVVAMKNGKTLEGTPRWDKVRLVVEVRDDARKAQDYEFADLPLQAVNRIVGTAIRRFDCEFQAIE
jgi:hypothetical protein